MGAHLKKELVSSSFERPFLFDDEVLAKVIATSSEDSHFDAQLSIAKAFTLPVVSGSARGSDRTASSGRGSTASSLSSSGFRGRGRGSDTSGSKHKASFSPGWARKEKSPRRGTSTSAKRKGSRR